MATVIPTNWNWEHWGNDTVGPSLRSALQECASDFAALNVRQKAIQAALDALVTDYNAHIVLTAGSVHGAADATNTGTALGTGGEVTIGLTAA